MTTEDFDKDKLAAAIDMIHRTGAKQIQIRHEDETNPIVWFVVVLYDVAGIVIEEGPEVNPTKGRGREVAASFDPLHAALRLCERLMDGGQCKHCSRPSGFEPDLLVRMPMDDTICWYQYDPGSKKYVRGCG